MKENKTFDDTSRALHSRNIKRKCLKNNKRAREIEIS